ncbi:hypothetical protein STA3757_35450 [Stanieria sp. NIES-3757]|nr:hypothetical protein STA3757_35450 [Stanieria sp. NIES-3757]
MLTKKTIRAIPHRFLLVLICFGVLTVNSGCSNTSINSQSQLNSSTAVTNDQSQDMAIARVSNFVTQVVIPT